MDAQDIIERTLNASRNSVRLNTPQWGFQDSVAGKDSVFAEFQANVPHSIRPGVPLDLAIPAYESITADGDGNSTEYDLSHPLADDPASADDVVLYADGVLADPDAINYDADSFEYTDDGTAQDLEVFYLSSAQAEMTLRISAPKNVFNEPITLDLGLQHLRDTHDDPVTFSPSSGDIAGALEGVTPTDYSIEARVSAPYKVVYESDSGATADNMVLTLPVWKAQAPIKGLPALKKQVVR
jgi:hypothetical protein